MLRYCMIFGVLALLAVPASAGWRATTPQAKESVNTPRVAAALEAATRFDDAILKKDSAVFESLFADDAVINNPFNKIARKADALNNLRTGLIDYTSLDRSIEYAAVRGEHEVLLMGEETLTPVGNAKFANKHVRRRTTEIWTDESGTWQLLVRQATIYSAE
jgi:ketosteroid isomerase-like protein